MKDTVGAALAAARALGVDRLDAHLLLARVLKRPRVWLLAHGEAELTAPQQAAFDTACRRRADGEPLAYVLGEREFHGLMLQITPAVLVPRPETETLVDWALELLAGTLAGEAAVQVADLGTGSGAIALALKHRHPAAQVCAVELSEAAVALARANAATHVLQLEFQLGSWWQPLRGRRFHLVVGNPPYVAADDPHLATLRHEPRQALTPGGDGMAAIEHIVGNAPAHLLAGGWLLLEHGHEQGDAVRRCFGQAGFRATHTRVDLAGRPRCTGGRIGPN